MRTVVLGERPAELEALTEKRRRLGLDGHDEVWDGVYVMAPHAHSDHGIVEEELRLALGPRAKQRGLIPGSSFEEILVADPDGRTVRCWRLGPDGYVEQARSALLDVDVATLVAEVDWPR